MSRHASSKGGRRELRRSLASSSGLAFRERDLAEPALRARSWPRPGAPCQRETCRCTSRRSATSTRHWPTRSRLRAAATPAARRGTSAVHEYLEVGSRVRSVGTSFGHGVDRNARARVALGWAPASSRNFAHCGSGRKSRLPDPSGVAHFVQRRSGEATCTTPPPPDDQPVLLDPHRHRRDRFDRLRPDAGAGHRRQSRPDAAHLHQRRYKSDVHAVQPQPAPLHGQVVTLRLLMNKDSMPQTSFIVDDTAVSMS